MSIYRGKRSPYWQFDFEIGGYRFSGSTKLTDKHDAAAFEKNEKIKARLIVQNIERTNSAPLTIGHACKRWWNEHGQHLNDPDLEARLAWLATAIGPATPLHAITDDTVSKLVELRRRDVRQAGRTDNGKQLFREITARTVNKTTVSLLRRVLRRARDNWDAAILKEPTWKKHWLKETKRPVRELSGAEDAALDAVEDADFIDVRRFAIITGLRRGNVLLKKSQVNFEQATIAIISKGGVPRILPLSKEAYVILWRRRADPTEYVFTFCAQRTRRCPKTGKKFVKGVRYPITYYGLGSNKRKWKAAGVEARIHDLRHTTGMRVLRATGNLKAVQKILGHSDIAITAKFYTDATLEDQRAAMETTAAAAPRLLDPPKKKAED